MKILKTAVFKCFSRASLAAVAICFLAAVTTGCNATGAPNPSLRSDLATIRTAHNDPDSIGSLDATAPPPNPRHLPHLARPRLPHSRRQPLSSNF